MTFFFQYLLRLSICFAIMYLFYAIVLRRLTFYNHNRWYLLGYSALCFIIPLINIASFAPAPQQTETGILNTSVVRMIPNVALTASPETQAPRTFDAEQLIVWIFFAGIAIMLLRLLFQLLSYKKLARSAKIISDDDAVKLYQVNEEIAPFSFGNSIFINRDLHDENALQEILQHEFVHVKQKHTLDILWGEILCILNWYNPFVWLTRRAIRENLEFIADDKVVQSGTDKQQYQYLLLRVMGNNNFSIANNFNFSSLKKRIAMMNKIKTAKIHLLKFLFLNPLLSVLLVSFRENKNEDDKRTSSFDRTYPLPDSLAIIGNKEFLKRNPSVKNYLWIQKVRFTDNNGQITSQSSRWTELHVFLKNGNEETYALNSANETSKLKNKYGGLPEFPFEKKTNANTNDNSISTKEKVLKINSLSRNNDTSSRPENSVKNFYRRNPNVKLTGLSINGKMFVDLKNGTREEYDLSNPEDKARAEKKYGRLLPLPPPSPSSNYSQVQIEPKFPGGDAAWQNYLKKNLRFSVPVDNHAPPGQYTITVSFLVHKDGSLSEIKVINAPKPDYGTAAEAVRVIERGPQWLPAIQNGHPVTYRQKQKIIFTVQAD